MEQSEIFAIIVIVINIAIAVGGFLVTVLMGLIIFTVKRLISSVDALRISNEEMIRSIDKRPDYDATEALAMRVATGRVTEHERDYSHEKKAG